MRGQRIIVAGCVAVLASLLPAASAGAKFRTAPDSALQRALEGIVDSPAGPPGIALLIDRGRHQEFFSAGTAGQRQTPMPNLRFRIASVAKGFNAYVGVKLAAQEKLSLETTLRDSIPGTLPAAEAVTLSQLLKHTSGLADYIRDQAFVDQLLAKPSRYFSPIQLIGFVRGKPLEFPPGTRYHYSDTDNIAAALIEEAASGSSYEQLLAKLVFGPLGMRDSSLPRTVKMPPPFLHGYDVEPGKKPEDVSELLNPAGAWASGGIVSTPIDLGRFARSYVPTILGATSGLSGAFRSGSSSPPGPGKNSAGPGIFRYRTGCGTVYGHTGSFPGYRILVAASANGRRSVVFVANAQIVPGQGSPKAAKAITQVQARAICRALGPSR
ncbi:MAG TPA: serine hydrolase domain-containing protein [Solirubrobacterales bacterium]|nr:serine hydrolase domain-containing protein [Solirubrobacterales bacterium]